jgi:predicted glycosyltransferase
MVHPADVHFFRFAIGNLVRKGNAVCVASREKDITLELLDAMGIENTSISNKGNGTIGLFRELAGRDYRLFGLARHFRPDIIVANNSPCGTHVAWLLGIPSIVFDDTEIHRFNQMLYYPLVTEVHSPDCYRTSLGRKHHFYPGYHSLAYLHPDHFQPDPEILRKGGLNPAERMVLLRFVGWGAMHDAGLAGLSRDNKYRLVKKISEYARVLISSEADLDSELEAYRVEIPLADIHHLLAYVDVVIGESATMCSEAVSLGTPAIFIDEKGRGYTDEQEKKYGLCSNFKPDEYNRIEARITELLSLDDVKSHHKTAWSRMIAEKINVAAYQTEQIYRLVSQGR